MKRSSTCAVPNTTVVSSEMNERLLLRREWFGGLLIELPGARMTFLDQDGYERQRLELADRPGDGLPVRIVDATTRGYPLRRDALSTPGTLYIELTRRCDGGCTHCYADAGPAPADDEMTLAEIERLLREFAAWGGYYVRLTGGEPTLHEDFLAILDVIADESLKPSVNTHGRYGEGLLREMLARGVRDIRISLDGTEEVNDAIRGPGNYRSVLATLHRLAESNRTAVVPADPTINVVLMKSNRHCLSAIIGLAAELGFKLSFGLLRVAGRGDVSEMLSPEEVAAAAYEVQQLRQSLGLPRGRVRINYDIFCETASGGAAKPFPFDNSQCPLGTMGLGVSAEGRIMACNYLGYMHGDRWLGEDVRQADLMGLWTDAKIFAEARALTRSGCQDCDHYITRCNGGCPASACALTGDLDGRDPYCVKDIPLGSFPPLAAR